MKRATNTGIRILIALSIALFMTLLMIGLVSAAFPMPTSPDSMVNTTMDGPIATGGFSQNTTGGTITVVNINATTQNPHWKAYVGNISGKLALQDASSNAVYDWNVTSMEGEIYATRKSSIVDWENIVCASGAHVTAEETALNMTTSNPDSIVNTFDSMSHAEFYAGLTHVNANSCNSTNLYVNSQSSADFEEVLLYVATSISEMEVLPEKEFNAVLNTVLFGFKKNASSTQKTIDNWRTEISALFAFMLNL